MGKKFPAIQRAACFLFYRKKVTSLQMLLKILQIQHWLNYNISSILSKIIDDSFPYFAHEISKVDSTRVFISHWCWNFQEVKLND